MRKRSPHTLTEEAGITLVELMIATTILAVILATALPALVAGMRAEPKVSRHAADIGHARAALERMTRELRQGYAVDAAGASQITFRTYTRKANCGGTGAVSADADARACTVTYSCDAGSCSRTEAEPNTQGSGSTAVLIDGLTGASVFSYGTGGADPTYVQISLAFAGADGDETVTISDGVSLRNISGAS